MYEEWDSFFYVTFRIYLKEGLTINKGTPSKRFNPYDYLYHNYDS